MSAHVLDFVVNSIAYFSLELSPLYLYAWAGIFFQYLFRFLFSMTEMEFDVNCFQVGLEKYRNEKHLHLKDYSPVFVFIIKSLKTIQAASFSSCL